MLVLGLSALDAVLGFLGIDLMAGLEGLSGLSSEMLVPLAPLSGATMGEWPPSESLGHLVS